MIGLRHKAAGISIEQTGIRYISFKANKQIHKKRFIPLLPGMIVENQIADREALLDRLKQWVKQKGMRGSAVDVSIPPSQMIVRKMMIPSTGEKQIEQLVKLEVETGLHLPFENPVYDYVITEQDENQSQLIIFAAPRKVVQDYVDVLEDAGLRVRTVEVTATALARSIVAGYGHEFSETMLIHLEQSLLDIYMFRSGHPVFMRTIDLVDLSQEKHVNLQENIPFLAEAEVAATSHEHLSTEQVVEITAEISRMLSFYQYSLHDGSTRISEILITGSPEMRVQLQEELQAALPEMAIAPIAVDQFSQGAKPDNTLNDYRTAAGAALRDSKVRSINLLPREDRETIVFPYIAISLAAIWILGVVGSGVLYASVQGQYAERGEQILAYQEQNGMLQTELAGLNGRNSSGGGLDRSVIIEAMSASRADAAAVMNELEASLPYGGVIRDIKYSYHSEIILSVNFTAMEHSTVYLTALREMSFSKGASIQKLTEGTENSGNSVAKYTAVFRVNMVPVVEQSAQAQSPSEGGEDSSGTN
ncbi:pilus assembly protein PilM [Paenibacillus sp. FSL M7-0420]|uniref:pilus assembly protein PilM n=1 Tax=Paenibacillus sp. FSL M7-0420 TaxID=2921609 RepID=UPI0030F60DE8